MEWALVFLRSLKIFSELLLCLGISKLSKLPKLCSNHNLPFLPFLFMRVSLNFFDMLLSRGLYPPGVSQSFSYRF